MSNAFAIASSGLKTEEFFIDKLANDMANLNTPNYKSTHLVFADAVSQNQTTHAHGNSRENAQFGLGSYITQTNKNFSPGPLKPGNNWSDVAIAGNGFFQVERDDGQSFYTRSSQLSIDEDHYLTAGGYRLSDNIRIPTETVNIEIKKNGEVKVQLPNETQAESLGSIKLTRFMNPEHLTSLDSGLYEASEDCGEAISDAPDSNGLGALLQNQIENSNVDMVSTLMQLTMAQRIYQLNARAIQIVDDMEKMINELRN